MAITYSDTFTAPDGTRLIDHTAETGHGYTGPADLAVFFNGLFKSTTTNAEHLGFVAGLTTSASYEILTVWIRKSDNSSTDLLFGVQDSLNFYMLRFRSNSFTLFEVVGGTFTSIATYAQTLTTGTSTNTVKIRVNGNSIAIDYGATLNVMSVSSSAISKTGSIGFRAQGADSGLSGNAVSSVSYEPLNTTPGLTSKTLQRSGVNATAATAGVFIFAGHGVNLSTATAAYVATAATLTSGVLADIDLSATAIVENDNITVVALPAAGGPGIVIETTAEVI